MNKVPAGADCLLSGSLPRDLGNAVSDAIWDACERGLSLDAAICVVLAVAADYAKQDIGDHFVERFTEIAKMNAQRRFAARQGGEDG